MKVITVLGSPRRNGNTAKVLENVESLLRKTHEVERIDIISQDVRGCLGCTKVSVRPTHIARVTHKQ